MGLFDFFKKKEETPNYDVTNLSVRDLGTGFVFDYDLEQWVVKASYEYDWGGGFISREFLIDNGSEQRYLSVDEEDELELTLSQKMKLSKIGRDLPNLIAKDGHPPSSLAYEGRQYVLEEESPGYFRDLGREEEGWTEFLSWEYWDEEEEHVLTIEQWEERSFEAAIGKAVEPFEITNITPATTK